MPSHGAFGVDEKQGQCPRYADSVLRNRDILTRTARWSLTFSLEAVESKSVRNVEVDIEVLTQEITKHKTAT
jgi:hypothetical protein